MIEILNSLALQGLRIENDLATRIAFSTFVTADGFVRFTFLGNGRQEWGNGTALADTNLYRSAVGTLTTDGKIEALTGIKLTNSSTV